MLDDPAGAQGSWPLFLLLPPGRQRRDAALEQLWPAGYGVGRLFIQALPDYAYLAGIVPAQDVSNARGLSIGNSPWLDDGDVESICRALG